MKPHFPHFNPDTCGLWQRSLPGVPAAERTEQFALSDRLKILLAEDNLVNQKVTLRQLQHLGYGADVAPDGRAAVEAFRQTAYNLVLMDCQMPQLDGYSATEQIRAIEQQMQRCPAVVIAITANFQQEDQERAIAAGMNDYLRKPVTQAVLAQTLAQWSLALAAPPVSDEVLHGQIDWSYLHRLCDYCIEFEWELLRVFVSDSRSWLGLLRQSLTDRNYGQIEHSAHHLNGASGNIGAIEMQAAAAQLEQQARQQQLDGSDRLLLKLETSLHQIQVLLQRQPVAGKLRQQMESDGE